MQHRGSQHSPTTAGLNAAAAAAAGLLPSILLLLTPARPHRGLSAPGHVPCIAQIKETNKHLRSAAEPRARASLVAAPSCWEAAAAEAAPVLSSILYKLWPNIITTP